MFTRHRCRAVAAGTATLLALGMATLPVTAASAAVQPVAPAATPASGPATTPATAPASGSATTPATGPALQVVLKALGLSVQLSDGHLAATGPGPVVSAACTALGTDLGLGAIAFYDKPNQLGNSILIFTGDNAPATAVGTVTGATVVNFQNCTNQTWYASNPGDTAVDATAMPGTDQNINPTDFNYGDSLTFIGKPQHNFGTWNAF